MSCLNTRKWASAFPLHCTLKPEKQDPRLTGLPHESPCPRTPSRAWAPLLAPFLLRITCSQYCVSLAHIGCSVLVVLFCQLASTCSFLLNLNTSIASMNRQVICHIFLDISS